ncbi:Eukaryotic translation initiation factor isoform 4G-1 [Auxenochlorella protothecoides]|uniref:Eukaryotic translation initiation factor isoform 4G-1 n=1 Tax=Auxenochlorella protothecoides TaxID=3075 RepID=A0A087SJS5_AUXPR|nr:Eukaryotic translation initiation factor isoform 4G-1 [Auxenochlorella protothecoides]KFM25979.1 Eukaryotic translation initiation factor isoform 4G-1 [Auxenochlorella protothecoides]
MSGSEASKVHYYIDEKWDNAIDITMRSVFYGSLIGAVGGLFLLRGKTARVASLAFGAGFGAGGAYYQNQKAVTMATQGGDTISLRPLSLRPGGGTNPFAGFAKGAGVGLKLNTFHVPSVAEKRKPRGEVITYSRDFLMTFASQFTEPPSELRSSALDIVLDPSDPTRLAQQQLLQRRASDLGRTAWSAGGSGAEGTAQTMRTVKGILNKLTPEKFERLLGQFIPLISNYEVLQATIIQVFESAVHQPTFVAMYADLCRELDAVLPEFNEPDTGRPTNFKKMLANTCQEEYESTESARAVAAKASGPEREAEERLAKQRLLGNIRLIAELFKKGMVNDRIMLLILMDLLGTGEAGPDPPAESIEAVCELLSTAGAALEAGAKSRPRLDAAFATLSKLANARGYPSRIRFVIRDVIELRTQHWVPRREAFTAKKLEDVRAVAAAELGLDVNIPGLDGTGAGGALGALTSLAPKRPEELELTPIDVTPERRESLAKSIFTDFLADGNFGEALAAAQDLAVPGFMRRLAEIGLARAYDARTEEEWRAVVDLMVRLGAAGQVPGADLGAAVAGLAPRLEDDAMDFRFAPAVLGTLLGRAAAGKQLGLDALDAAAGAVESAAPRRGLVAATLCALRDEAGAERLVPAVAEAGLDLAALLASDPEFDGELLEPAAFLAAQGLDGLL